MLTLVLNEEHLDKVLEPALSTCRHRLFIATANLKHVHLPVGGGAAKTLLKAFDELSVKGVEIRLLHSGVPSGPFLETLKKHVPERLEMRRCPRVHLKAVVVDGRWMYLGSANLTGAGLGAKGPRRRNFEAGVVTDDLGLIDPVADLLNNIWVGHECLTCGRRDHCPVPLEEPEL